MNNIYLTQEEILCVHYKILEGDIDVKVNEDIDKNQTLTITRFFVPTNQVDCVLGKGRNIIQQIYIKSGSQIHFLSRE